jgi:hypothetical protein
MRSWWPFCCGWPGLDPLDLDAEPVTPDRELGEVEQGIGTGQGRAVVGADGFG